MNVNQATLLPTHTEAPERRPRRRILAGALGFAALLAIAFLGLCQAVLPAIATSRLQSSLEKNGDGVRVAIHAFPAAELLVDRADSVTIHIAQLRPGGHGGLDLLLQRASHTTRLEATVGKLFCDGIELQDVSLRKRGPALHMQASITRAAIQRALPADIQLLGSAEGERALSLRITAHVFGHALSASARVLVHDGTLQISPTASFLDLAHITLFADPQVAVDAIRMSAHGETYVFAAEGRYV